MRPLRVLALLFAAAPLRAQEGTLDVLDGPPPSQPGEAMRRMKVVDWFDPSKTALDPEH